MDSDGPSPVSIALQAPAWQVALGAPERLCRRALEATLARAAPHLRPERVEVSVLLADDATVQALNALHRGRDRATNVLSFPLLSPTDSRAARPLPGTAVMLGDIALAFETVRAEAARQVKPLPDHASHLLVHGCLHLLGHDHQDAAEASTMEALERRILADLGIPDPYDDGCPSAVASAAMESVR